MKIQIIIDFFIGENIFIGSLAFKILLYYIDIFRSVQTLKLLFIPLSAFYQYARIARLIIYETVSCQSGEFISAYANNLLKLYNSFVLRVIKILIGMIELIGSPPAEITYVADWLIDFS